MSVVDARRLLIWERDGGLCGICGQAVDLQDMEIDHIVGRVDGGSDDESNLRASHRRCNRQRGVRQRKQNGQRPRFRDEVRFAERLPGDLHAALVHLADQEARSLNGQIVYMLRQQLRLSGAPGGERA